MCERVIKDEQLTVLLYGRTIPDGMNLCKFVDQGEITVIHTNLSASEACVPEFRGDAPAGRKVIRNL